MTPPARPAPVPTLGILEWFQPGEHERVEQTLEQLRRWGVEHLRTGVSWADCHTREGEKWYAWLLPRLGREVELLPCFLYTPPSLGIAPRTSAPPRDPKAYADFLDVMITRYGQAFEWVELWNEPTNLSEWDWGLDPGWERFAHMVGGAAYWAQQRGKRVVLGGMCPADPEWLNLIADYGLLPYVDAVGLHGFPGTWQYSGWEGWAPAVESLQAVLARRAPHARVWITEAGYSTWRHDEFGQLQAFLRALEAPAERLYWYGAYDLHESRPTVDGFHTDEREYHFGIQRADGRPKLLARVWADGGLPSVRRVDALTRPAAKRARRADAPTLITGGAGFVGTNLAALLCEQGHPVRILDNLSRAGVEENLAWLRERYPDCVEVAVADLRDRYAVRDCVQSVGSVFHLAAQTAVTTSLHDPVDDFEVNARGTLNLLEALRAQPTPVPLIYTSTNKVYGGLRDLALVEEDTRYLPADPSIRAHGIDERSLDFHSPYGCSKGAADQYVIDYGRTYGLPTAVLRMSCMYGPHQFGTEDQGWVAHFLISAIKGTPLNVYGDGKQVRDVLHVHDLVQALLAVRGRIDALRGRAFNIGGGARHTLSLRELIELIGRLHGQRPPVTHAGWRPGDQRYYASDTRALETATGWRPTIAPAAGVKQLYNWLLETRFGAAAQRVASEGML
ncbi:GDP-mannose 4,6-dehydratase [Ectothiorhodospiraceae bacterium 2226]|nr:GDP-mannose 4,6-dehydratase [Ectothiorhodospiraceae bacterium 2226]